MVAKELKRYALITVGIVIMCIALYFFLIPADLAVGGLSGLAMVVQAHFPNFPISAILLVMNIILLTISFIIIGKEFGASTIYSSFLMSGTFFVFERLFPNPGVSHDIIINLVYGIFIQGIGMAIVFFQNSSTGGTDIVAKIINHYTYIDIGKALFLSDCIIVLLAAFTFGIEKGLYALLGILMNSFIIDGMIAKMSSKMNLMIMTTKVDEVNDFIIKKIDRGTTLFKAEGGFTEKDKYVINTVCNRKQYYEIKKFTTEIDSQAFITVTQLNDVVGNGFTFYLD